MSRKTPGNQEDLAKAVEAQMLKALNEKETELDEQIKALDGANKTDDDELHEIRRKRLEQMQSQSKSRQRLQTIGHGEYNDIEEKEFFQVVKNSDKVVCHFYRSSTWRCAVVDKHLSALAQLHFGVRFVKINAEKAPYLAERLRIVMLPTVMLIKNGKTDHSIIGFDELGDKDDFTTNEFEEVLRNHDMLPER